MKIAVASKNPVKLNCSRLAFEQMLPGEEYDIEGYSVSSEVTDNPMSSKEALLGAKNRVKNVRAETDADYYVGIEAGNEELEEGMYVFAWVYVENKDGKSGQGKSAMLLLPEKLAEPIRKGIELGDAHDELFGVKNSKQKNGTVGLLTRNIIDRTTYYVAPTIMALVPFVHKDLY